MENLIQNIEIVDRSEIGRLRISGLDSLDLLDRLSTNDLKSLQPDNGITTVLTSNKGRILDLLTVLHLDNHLTVFTGVANQLNVAEWIEFYTFAEDVSVEDITSTTSMVGLIGHDSTQIISDITKFFVRDMALYQSFTTTVRNVEMLVVRTDFLQVPGYDLIVATENHGQLMDIISGIYDGQKPVEMDPDFINALRIEKGIPAFGHELTDQFNPLEAGLIDLISFTKGCYVGQEVVTRLNTYNKVQKKLVKMRWNSVHTPSPGTKLLADGKQAGVVTSTSNPECSEGGVGLGYVRLNYGNEGTILSDESEGDVEIIPINLNPSE